MKLRKYICKAIRNFCFMVSVFAFACSLFAAPLTEQQAHARAWNIVKKMTLTDKIDMLSGGSLYGTKGMKHYGVPVFLMADGPAGIRVPPPAIAYASGIALASSWDTDLAREVGVQLGRDARAAGVDFLLGPGVNIYRAPMNGRNYEYFGEDPFLASRIAVGYIEGIQSQGVSATIKHFAANNSEFARRTSNSVIDEHTLREIYLPVFEAAVKEAHVDAVMDSYNLVNGEHSTQNAFLNEQVLRHDWGFQGIVMSDWGATHDGLAAAIGGLDLEMPFGAYMNRKALLTAIQQKMINESDIDRKVERILYIAALRGYLDSRQADTNISRLNQDGAGVALRGAEEGMVLLKNDHHLLPLDLSRVKKIAVIGPNAFPAIPTAGGSGQVSTFEQSSVLTGLSDALRGKTTVTYAQGIPTLAILSGSTAFHTTPNGAAPGVNVVTFNGTSFEGTPKSTRTELAMSSGEPSLASTDIFDLVNDLTFPQIVTLFAKQPPTVARWTGYYTAQKDVDYTLFVQDPGNYRLLVDGKVLIDNSVLRSASLIQKHPQLSAGEHKVEFEDLGGQEFGASFFRVGLHPTQDMVDPYAVRLAKEADVVVLALGFQPDIESESMDRSFELPPGQDELVKEVAAVNPHVIVAITSGGSVNVTPWLAKVPALVELWYPGQDGGRAFANVVLGKVDPSGRLPISWEKRLEDNPSFKNYYFNDPSKPNDIVYREGVFVGYRGYEHTGTQPLFPFGFGLSYTQFAYRKMSVSSGKNGTFIVHFFVKNTGGVKGAAVTQIYLAPPVDTLPDEPIKTLVGFTRTKLAPGEEREISVTLTPRSFTHFDVKTQQWQAASGTYTVLLGQSSEQIEGKTHVTLPVAIRIPVNAR